MAKKTQAPAPSFTETPVTPEAVAAKFDELFSEMTPDPVQPAPVPEAPEPEQVFELTMALGRMNAQGASTIALSAFDQREQNAERFYDTMENYWARFRSMLAEPA